jgi:ubiquitin-conjugating enzyme E2 C
MNKPTIRIQKELRNLMMNQYKYITACPENDNIYKWIGTIIGPEDTYYTNLRYRLSIEFPEDYPLTPPKIKFVTKCFHPNIDYDTGNICLDILKDKWSPALDISTTLLSICSLLSEPNNEDPLNNEAANMWNTQPDEFRNIVLKYAKASLGI